MMGKSLQYRNCLWILALASVQVVFTETATAGELLDKTSVTRSTLQEGHRLTLFDQRQGSANDVSPNGAPPTHFITNNQQPTTGLDLLAQIETVQIINIQLEETEIGLQVSLENADGELPAPTTTVSGNALIAEIANVTLSLPEGNEFLEFAPVEAVAVVQVSALPGNRVQVVITGTDAPPTAAVETTATGLALSVVPGVAQAGEVDEALRLVVTGDEDPGYAEPNATTATRTETPLIRIPQSIQVIPEAVLEDQQVIRLSDALRNVPGVVPGNNFGGGLDTFTIRGFEGAAILRDGFRSGEADSNGQGGLQETANLERIEVLRGPASIL
ncbi:MAG: TonB-dependent receptor plug domain-containing protein [Leptolyngbyaceae cyanobacterium]